ncbi:MAG TPA: acetyl-CoA C-acetyltransferase [Candidatus Limnocylindrales bacterium]|nr:acetyl-CoA C-acetyltransferase [Candidatus Limnocylindrales bacterium]
MHKDVVIIGGARTPFGKFLGSLKDIDSVELATVASKEAMRRARITPDRIDHVVFGNVIQTHKGSIYLARHIGLKSGVPISTPALTVNRLCGSGLQAIVYGAQLLLLGEATFVLAGGTENMSQAPYVLRGAREGFRLSFAGNEPVLQDSLGDALVDTYHDTPMAITAENLAQKYQITRQEVDEFALRSQMKARAAIMEGRLKEEIVPMEITDKKGRTSIFDTDEHPRMDTTLEGLLKLPPVFKKDGCVTAGNASGICDGAAAVVLTTADIAEKEGLTPLGRLVNWGLAGVDPDIMGIGPADATRIVLKKANLSLKDLDLIEINEAFAAQYLAVEKELGLDREKVNVNGGAIALGHPVGASGARLALTLLYELRRREAKYGLASLCIGGGQGIAAIFERIS